MHLSTWNWKETHGDIPLKQQSKTVSVYSKTAQLSKILMNQATLVLLPFKQFFLMFFFFLSCFKKWNRNVEPNSLLHHLLRCTFLQCTFIRHICRVNHRCLIARSNATLVAMNLVEQWDGQRTKVLSCFDLELRLKSHFR